MSGGDFKRIVESLKVPVAITDAKGILAFANLAFAELARGAGRAEAGTAIAALFAADDRKRIEQNIGRVAAGKAGSALLEARLEGRKGTRWVQASLQPSMEAGELPAGVLVVLQDIDTQRETEQALSVLTGRLLALAESSPAAAMIEDTDGDIQLVNEPFCALLGIESAPQSIMGLAAEDVLRKSVTFDAEPFRKAREEGAGRVVFKRADGHDVTLERHPVVVEGETCGGLWSPLRETAGEEAGTTAAEIALVEKIGEELSTALDGIAAISARAQQMDFDPVLVDHFQRIRRSTETALAAIGDLVDFTKVSGSVVLSKTRFALREALAGLVGRLLPEAEEHDCRLRIKVEQDVSDALEGDVERLELVLRNLMVNTFALAPGAEVTLQITPEYETDSGMQLSFGVVVGEAAPRHARRASAEAGMGVAVAKFMVAAMGGKLLVSSQPMPGEALYAFTIEFPVRPAPPLPARPTYVSLVGLPVLVAASNSAERHALSERLRGWRMLPLEADNGAMAMALLERLHDEGNPVPLVILANRLGQQDGFLLAFRIKHHPKLRATIVMMLAQEGKPGDAIACRENGISAYMRYPINDRQLQEAIAAVTGASLNIEETPTLVTRHSLRESRKGATVLLVDPSRESQILAAHILGRHDCSVVVAQTLDEALAALDQDMYDLVVVDTSIEGLDGDAAPATLRERIARDREKARLVAASAEHSAQFHAAKVASGFNDTIAKPFRKEELLALLEPVRRIPQEAA